MHDEAYAFLKESLRELPHLRFGDQSRVLEFGSRNINGSARELFTSNVTYVGVDIEPGPGVDIVRDAAEVEVHGEPFDVVICMEVAEHTPRWREIIINAHKHLIGGGVFIFTAACEPRLPHSAVDGENMQLPLPEYYENIDPIELKELLVGVFPQSFVTTHPRGDVYAKAIR